MDLERTAACLQTYSGRDKAARTLMYALRMVAGHVGTSPELAAKLSAMAAQFSSARLIGRRFGDVGMVLAMVRVLNTDVAKLKDETSFKLDSLVTYLYTVYNPIEHMAWLCDLKVINASSSRFWRVCLYIWLCALTIGIIRSVRVYMRLAMERAELNANDHSPEELVQKDLNLRALERAELLTITQHACDMANGVNDCPPGFLWAGALPKWKASMFGMVASAIGLYKVYRSV